MYVYKFYKVAVGNKVLHLSKQLVTREVLLYTGMYKNLQNRLDTMYVALYLRI